MLTRDAILSLSDLKREPVEVPEWGGTVYVRSMSGAERRQFFVHLGKDELTSAHMVAWCACDENGNRLFTDEDVEALSKKHGRALDRIANAALKFNGLAAEAEDEAKNG